MNKIINRAKKHYSDNKDLWISWLIFWISFSGIIFSLVGSIIGAWGPNPSYFWLFFTQVSNITVILYYFMRVFYYYKNKEKYNNMTSVKFHGGITSYISLTMLIWSVILVPIEVSSLYLDTPGALPIEVRGSGNILAGSYIGGFWLHLVTPTIVIIHFYKFKGNNNQINNLDFKDAVMRWAIFPSIYLIIVYIIGLSTGVYPYTIISPKSFESGQGFGYYIPLFIFGIGTMYIGLIKIMFILKNKEYRKQI